MDIWPQRLYYQSTISFPCCVSIRTTIFFNSVCPLITETLPLLCPRAHSHNLPRWILKQDIGPRGCGIQRKLFDIPSILEIVYVYHMVYESGLSWLRYKTAGGLPMQQNLFPEGKKRWVSGTINDIYPYLCCTTTDANQILRKLRAKVMKMTTCKRKFKRWRWWFGSYHNTQKVMVAYYYLYISFNQQTLIYSILLRSAQQRTLYDNELLHFQDRWKMCCTPLLCSSLLLSTPLHLDGPPTSPHGPGRNPSMAWHEALRINRQAGGMRGGVRQWKKSPHPPHQYCSLTWWKLTLASIFHRVIGREDQMPWLDMPTLLPVQMMTHSPLHYSWHLQRRGRSWGKSVESSGCSRVRLSTSRSCSGTSIGWEWVTCTPRNG